MAGEYGVNINLRVKGQSGLDRLKQKVNQLTASVDKIRAIDIMNPRNVGGKGGKQARKELKKYTKDMEDIVKAVNNMNGAFGKTANQQMAAADALQEYANSLEIGTDKHKAAVAATEKQVRAMDKETTAIKKNNEQRKKNTDLASKISSIFGRGKKGARGGGGDGALSSALVSGAFPLLFGQGLLGGAAGVAGGFIGTKAGGQMGGFAGGLVATAVLQQITTLVNSMNQLGNAFNEIEPDINQLTVSLGIAGTMEQKRLQIIARSEGAHVALAIATEKMNKAIGEKGVRNLQEFAESSRVLGNSFTLAMTKMQAALAPFFKFFADMAGGITGAKQKERERLLGLGEGAGGSDAAILTLLIDQLAVKSSTKKNRAKRNRIKAEIGAIEERLIKEGKSIDLANVRQELFNEATKSIEQQNTFLQNQLLLGQQGAEIEREKARIAKKMGIDVKDLTDAQVTQIENNIKIRDQLENLNTLYSSITSTVETGLVDAIEGAIQGTKTLGDVARSVFTQIQRSLIQFGVNAFLGGLPGVGRFFRADGGPVSKGKSYIVGERGPEMFTPGSTGMITPNHELGGSSTNVVVNVDASGSSVEGDEQRGRELGRVISVAVQSELLEQKRPGGLLA